jgi:hypothetical protein
MSRHFEQPDSLEMLLDTMCNTFGGIILIALLVTLLARQTRAPAQTQDPALSAAALAQQADSVRTELREAQARLAALTAQAGEPRFTNRLELIRERQSLEQRRDQIERQEQDTRRLLAESAAAATTNLQSALAALRVRTEQARQAWLAASNETRVSAAAIAEAQGRIDQVQSDVRELDERRVRPLRLPREHATEKRPWDVVLRYGRVYPVHDWSQGRKVRNTASLAWERADDTGDFADPQPGLGWDLNSDARAWGEFLRRTPAQQYYLVFQVYEDSFATFNRLKAAVARCGLESSWVPRLNGTRLKAAAGGQAPPPQ